MQNSEPGLPTAEAACLTCRAAQGIPITPLQGLAWHWTWPEAACKGRLESCTPHAELQGLLAPPADTPTSVQGLAGQLEFERSRRMVAEGQVSHLEGAVREGQQRVAALQQEVEDLRRQLAQQKDLAASQKEQAGAAALQQQVEGLRRQLAQQKDSAATQKEQAEQVRSLQWSAIPSSSCSSPDLCNRTPGAHVIQPKTAEGAVLHDKLRCWAVLASQCSMPSLSVKALKGIVNVEQLHARYRQVAAWELEPAEGLERNPDCVAVAACLPTLQAHPAGCNARAGATQACITGGTACEHGPLQLTRHLACS